MNKLSGIKGKILCFFGHHDVQYSITHCVCYCSRCSWIKADKDLEKKERISKKYFKIFS